MPIPNVVVVGAGFAVPIRSILRKEQNAEVVLGRVVDVDLAARRLLLEDGALSYDYLILGAGAHDSYFQHPEWVDRAKGLKSIEDALTVRRKIFFAFEQAERAQRVGDEAARKAWLTFVLVGAGPTGVEMAGALAEISRHTLAEDFRHIDPADARIVLVEGHPQVLPSYAEPLARDARRTLESLGVEVRTGSHVVEIDPQGVRVGSERIVARTLIWSAGVRASPLAEKLGAPLDHAGRVLVTPELTLPGHDEVFVVGDMAHVEHGGTLVPGLAPAAMQMGRHAARNILRRIEGEPYEAFVYKDKGSFAVIGRGAAVGVAYGHSMHGLVAWLAWLFIHLFFLIGFRNRLSVLAKWAYAYATMRRYARLITGLPQG
jgi:NADH dehydrogenase